MQISYKTDYSLKVILYLSGCYPDGTAQIKQIADAQDIPKKFLEQILLLLKKGGFVASKQGPHGGYFLTRAPKEITVGAVIRFVEGPIRPISCIAPGAEESCSFTATCVFRDIWLEVESAIAGVIDAVTFSDLLERERKKRGETAVDFQI